LLGNCFGAQSTENFEHSIVLEMWLVAKRIFAWWWSCAEWSEWFGIGAWCCPHWSSEISGRAKSRCGFFFWRKSEERRKETLRMSFGCES
jgi:hypothetical protein